MRIYSFNLPENLIDLEKNSDLNLKIGDLLTAKIIKVDAGKALLEINGQKIVAELETNLHPGDEIKVRVVGELNNKLILKLLTETTSNTSSFDQLLDKLGIEADNAAKNALAFLLKNNLPITANSVKALLFDQQNSLLQILIKVFGQEATQPGIPNQQNSTEIAPNQQRLTNSSENSQLVPTGDQQQTKTASPEKTVDAIVKNNSPHQSVKVGQFLQAVNKLQKNVILNSLKQSASTNHPLNESNTTDIKAESPTGFQDTNSSEQKSTFQPTQSKIASLIINDEKVLSTTSDSPKVAEQQPNQIGGERIISPKKTPLTVNQNLEEAESVIQPNKAFQRNSRAHLLQLLKTGKSPVFIPSSKQTTDSSLLTTNHQKNPAQVFFKNPSRIQFFRSTVPSLLEELGLAINPSRSLPEIIKGLKSLVANLGLSNQTEESSQTMDEKPTSATTTPLPLISPLSEEQQEGVKELLDKFMGIRLHQKADDLLLHMEIPLLFDEQLTAILQIKKDDGKQDNLTNKKPLHILFHLEMEHLGKIKILLLLTGKEISCQFSAQTSETRMLIRKMIPDLENRLKEMPYQITHLGVGTLKEEETSAQEPIFGQIDFRV